MLLLFIVIVFSIAVDFYDWVKPCFGGTPSFSTDSFQFRQRKTLSNIFSKTFIRKCSQTDKQSYRSTGIIREMADYHTLLLTANCGFYLEVLRGGFRKFREGWPAWILCTRYFLFY